jgi:membrane-bound lytic murein transglycosylase C
MKISMMTLALLLFIFGVTAEQYKPPSEDDLFAELEQSMDDLDNEGSERQMNEYLQWKESHLSEYQLFRQEHFQRIDDIRDNLISLWGEAEVSTQQERVEYSVDKKIKTVLDFQQNEIRISVLHDNHITIKKKDIGKVLNDHSEELSNFLGKTVDTAVVSTLVDNAKSIKSAPKLSVDRNAVLKKEIQRIKQQELLQKKQVDKIIDQFVNNGSEIDTSKQYAVIKQENTEKYIADQKAQIEKETLQRISSLKVQARKLDGNEIKKEELKNKQITTFTMPLAHRNNLVKAQPYIEQVKHQSDRWKLSPGLMLAIIHTESYFNPKAESHVPAYGLMQIVPRTAGIDVNRMLNKTDVPMTEEDLFLPNYNITAGVAYMHILNSRYLKGVTNPKSRLYCTVAAYNTGTGNVAKAFNIDKSRNIKKAARLINKLTPDQVYAHLIENLPYDETKHYLKRVIKRQKIYDVLDTI